MIIDCHAHLVPPSAARCDPRREGEVSVGQADRGGRQPRLCLRRQQADAAGVEAAQRHRRPAAVDGYQQDRASGRRRLARHVRQRASGRGGRALVAPDQQRIWPRPPRSEPRFIPLATVPLQDGARAAEVLQRGPWAGLQGRHDRHPAKGQGRRARRSRARCRSGRRPTNSARSSSSIRCSRAATTASTTTAWRTRSAASPTR